MTPITVSTVVNAPLQHVWDSWTKPEHITQWNAASDDWHCPAARNDVRVGGTFCATMAAKDGSASFDFEGTYTAVERHKYIAYVMSDGRKVDVRFEPHGDGINFIETFDPEQENPVEMQRQGWHAILENFKQYTESIA
jgi:uncharacterized protein YndB with AHSA1/START domain